VAKNTKQLLFWFLFSDVLSLLTCFCCSAIHAYTAVVYPPRCVHVVYWLVIFGNNTEL